MTDAPVDFLHVNNVCGRTLLTLVARGSAIIAELLRLSDHIPSVFTQDSKYTQILNDFRYLKSPELYDNKIDADSVLSELDEEFRDAHFSLLERFYKLFESIYKYFNDYITYLEELHEGVFVQHTIENVLEDRDGGQLMCEALYLYGVMLLLMDRRIEGFVREKLIICYYRYKGAGTVSNFEEVVKLCRSTGYSKGKRPLNYPEEYFARFRYPVEVVLLLISRLRTDDIYNHTSAYPSPQHRSIAYAAQSSMLYIILYFTPELLHRRDAIMREIVDKHFPDNWVIPYYMGYFVDLSDAWLPYKSASSALKNILQSKNIETELKRHCTIVATINTELDHLLTEGVLTEEFVLNNPRKLLEHVRTCNATLRWLLLHRTTNHKAYRELIIKSLPMADLMKLTMHTAQFEFILKDVLKNLLENKQPRWDYCKKETMDRMNELSDYYSGKKELTRVKKNESLQKWFTQLGAEIASLSYENSILVGRKMTTLITALDDVQQFNEVDQNLQVKEFLSDCREYLKKMVKTVNISNKMVGDLDIISDFAYAWELINDYTPFLHEQIKTAPLSCLLLRSTFLKLASILNFPLNRITQSNSSDDISVADYYSHELIVYVRTVLAIIPQSVFKILDKIISLQTNELKPLPSKMERKYLGDVAQLALRYNLAQFTHEIAVFTQGILAIRTTIMGIIKINPKQLLEDGIRKELVTQITTYFHEYLQFPLHAQIQVFEGKLVDLGKKLDGFKVSFEYIQDYINIYGCKIWQEELSRIMNYHVEQECNSFLKKKIYDWQSSYQSDTIPIPQFPVVLPLLDHPSSQQGSGSNKSGTSTAAQAQQQQQPQQVISVNFMGRLTRELINLTDVRRTVYVESMQGWYARPSSSALAPSSGQKGSGSSKHGGKTGADDDHDDSTPQHEIVGIRTFSLLMKSIGIFGLCGMDKLLCFMLVKQIQDFVRLFRKIIIQNKIVENYIIKLANELHPITQFPIHSEKLYANALLKTNKLWPLFLDTIVKIGQYQLIRRQIANELNFSCKLDSKHLYDHLSNLNQCLITNLQAHYQHPELYPNYPGQKTELLADISLYLETAGINNPLTKIYITTESVDHFPLIMFLFILSQLGYLHYHSTTGTLQNDGYQENKVPIDGAPLIIGMITLMKQFHSVHCHTFLGYLGQYVRAHVSGMSVTGSGTGKDGKSSSAAAASAASVSALPPEVVSVLLFLEEFCKFSHISRKAVDAMLPSYIFDRFAHQ